MYTYKAVIKNVVDGDTIDVTIDLGFDVYHSIRLRLADIDTPEMNSSLMEERERAKKAKAYVQAYLGREVVIKTSKADKYGRYIATVYISGELMTLNAKLLNEGLAVKYE